MEIKLFHDENDKNFEFDNIFIPGSPKNQDADFLGYLLAKSDNATFVHSVITPQTEEKKLADAKDIEYVSQHRK